MLEEFGSEVFKLMFSVCLLMGIIVEDVYCELSDVGILYLDVEVSNIEDLMFLDLDEMGGDMEFVGVDEDDMIFELGDNLEECEVCLGSKN